MHWLSTATTRRANSVPVENPALSSDTSAMLRKSADIMHIGRKSSYNVDDIIVITIAKCSETINKK